MPLDLEKLRSDPYNIDSTQWTELIDLAERAQRYGTALRYYCDDAKFGMDSHINGTVAREALKP